MFVEGDFFFIIGKRDFTFVREMRVHDWAFYCYDKFHKNAVNLDYFHFRHFDWVLILYLNLEEI